MAAVSVDINGDGRSSGCLLGFRIIAELLFVTSIIRKIIWPLSSWDASLFYSNSIYEIASNIYIIYLFFDILSAKSATPPVPFEFVNNVDYNAAGQIVKVEYGNGTVMDYTYDPLTLRLTWGIWGHVPIKDA